MMLHYKRGACVGECLKKTRVSFQRKGWPEIELTHDRVNGSRLTIRLPEKLQKDLDKVAKAEGTSKSDVIRDAIERYLLLKRLQPLRKKVLPFALLPTKTFSKRFREGLI